MYLFTRMASNAPQVLATLLVFSLSSGVLGGILFYMDSTSTDVLQDMRQDIPVDMTIQFTRSFYSASGTTLESIRDMIRSQVEIASAELVTVISGHDHFIPESQYRDYTILGIDESIFSSFSGNFMLIEGNDSLDANECYIEFATSERLDLHIGDNYTVSALYYDITYQPRRVNATYVIAGIFRTTMFYKYYENVEESITSLSVLIRGDSIRSDFSILHSESTGLIFDRVWTKIRDSVIQEGSAEQVRASLENVKKRIEQRSLPHAVVSDFAILGVVTAYASWASAMTTISLAFSIPSIVMGVMLVQYQSNLLSDERRRDIGTLVTRGSTGWQGFNWVLSSALVTGFVGSIGAVLTGFLASLLSASVREVMMFELGRLSDFAIILQPMSLFVVFLFSFGVGLLVALPSAIKALLMTPSEAHTTVERQALGSVEAQGNPSIEIILAAVSGVLLIPLIMLFQITGLSGVANVTYASVFIILVGSFIVTLARLLSRPAARVKARLLTLWGKSTMSVGSRVVARNLLTSRKSEAMGVFFLAMVFTAGLFSSISAQTGTTHMKNLIFFETGADIVLDVHQGLDNVTLETVRKLEQIQGVEKASGMLRTTGFISYEMQGESGATTIRSSIPLFGIEPIAFGKTAFLDATFSINGTPQASLQTLASNDRNIIASFRPLLYISGETPVYLDTMDVEIRTPWRNYSSTCNIEDVFGSDETGSGNSYLPGESDVSRFILMNLTYVHSCMNTTKVSKIYINLEDGADYNSILLQIQDMLPNSFEKMESALAQIDAAQNSRTGQSIQGVYTLNVIFSLVYLTIGMTVVSVVKSKNLSKQFSVLRALGADTKPIMITTLVDAMLGLLMAAIIGLLIGLVLTSIILQMPLVYTGVSSTISWQRIPISLAIPIPLISGIVMLAILFTATSTFFVTRNTLGKNIAEEIQHNE